MTAIDTSTEAVERLLDGVTQGPWQVDGPSWNQIIWSSNGNRVCFMAHSSGLNVVGDLAAASFIAAARDLVPALLAERDRLLKERDEAVDAKLDALSTLDAWFDRRKLGNEAVNQAVIDAASGYLRTSRVGGMPRRESDLILGVMQDMSRLGLFADIFARAMDDLVPALLKERDDLRAQIAEARAERDENHWDDHCVNQFAKMMREKMASSRAKGRSGWDDPSKCSVDHLRHLLYEHLDKGDPVDVANICMMLRHYDASTARDYGNTLDLWKTRADRAEVERAAQIEADARIAEEEGWEPDKPHLGITEREEGSRDCAERIATSIRNQPHSRAALDRLLAEAKAKASANALRRVVDLPHRIERLGGQNYAYVRVEEILALIPKEGEA